MRLNSQKCFALALIISTTYGNSWAEIKPTYKITLDPEKQSHQVTICLPRAETIWWTPAYEIIPYLRFENATARTISTGLPRGRIQLNSPPPPCVQYGMDWRRARTTLSADLLRKVGADWLISPQLLLLYPQNLPIRANTHIEIKVPLGYYVSTPWRLVSNTEPGSRVYHFPGSPPEWPSLIAISRNSPITLTAKTTRVELQIMDKTRFRNLPKLIAWIQQSLDALTLVYGKLPQPFIQIVVVPTSDERSANYFAQVVRGGSPALQFFIPADPAIAHLKKTGVAIHELSHLLLPQLEREDAWFSEGLATYYQYCLSARQGERTEQQTWTALHQGFVHAQKALHRQTLNLSSRDMHRDQSAIRVYWTGAAIMLLADWQLRQRTANKKSLDTTLLKLAQCCLHQPRTWSGKELALKLDALSGESVFIEMYNRYATSTQFPDLKPLYTALGLRAWGRSLYLNEEAPDLAIRNALMRSVEPQTNTKGD